MDWSIVGHWIIDNLDGVISAIVLVASASTLTWRYVRNPERQTALFLGRQVRKYGRWFAKKMGTYENKYLLAKGSRMSGLSLAEAYVSLSVTREDEVGEPLNAFTELRRAPVVDIFVLGDPGSGKSTLLRAYALRELAQAPPDWGKTDHRRIPFLVPLREFVSDLDPNQSAPNLTNDALFQYIVKKVLTATGVMRPAHADAFVRRALRQHRVDVLLDGLDEVPSNLQDALRFAVSAFRHYAGEDRPTNRARLIITCRAENFRKLSDSWRTITDAGVYRIAPLSDAEITSFVEKLRGAFDDPQQGPQAYLQAVHRSETYELHRVPLLLAMSVGLYASQGKIEIPNEINELYRMMVEELLRRHEITDGMNPIRFPNPKVKADFLAQFATRNAMGDPGFGDSFGDFSTQSLVDFATARSADFNFTPPEAALFVEEIIDHSGLLSRTKADHYVFAHRSLREYFVAQRLRSDAQRGADYLLSVCQEPKWHYVAVLYAATDRNYGAVDDFVARLAAVDLALAARCLAWSKVPGELAHKILQALPAQINAQIARGDEADAALRRQDATAGSRAAEDAYLPRVRAGELLAALFTAVRSPRPVVHDAANTVAEGVLDTIVDRRDLARILGTETGGLVLVVDALAHTDADHVARLVPRIAAEVAGDPRLVGPLWRCLQMPDMWPQQDATAAQRERHAGSRAIVSQLLTLVTQPDGLAELEAQDRGDWPPPTDPARLAAYPFPRRGRPLDSNLVTLLCWAERAGAAPSPPNEYFEFKRADPQRFARVEQEWHSPRRRSTFWLGRLMSGGGLLVGLAVVLTLVATDVTALVSPYGWVTLGWFVLPAALVPALFVPIVGRRRPARHRRLLCPGPAPGLGNSGHAVAEVCARAFGEPAGQFVFLASPFVYSVALSPLLDVAVPAYLALAVTANLLFVWLPFLAIFDSRPRGNPFVSVYTDERSRHWLSPAAFPLVSPSSLSS